MKVDSAQNGILLPDAVGCAARQAPPRAALDDKFLDAGLIRPAA